MDSWVEVTLGCPGALHPPMAGNLLLFPRAIQSADLPALASQVSFCSGDITPTCLC